jgi:dolichyl-phosphate beta-glucosyltransferase
MTGAAVDLSIVVPAYNESGRIGVSLDALRRELPPDLRWEILVVDDGSTDETAAMVDGVASADDRVRLLREPHRGKGGALRAGLLAARGARRFMCDADLSMPVSELSRFLAVVPAVYDIAIGTREGAGARRVGEPPFRHVTGRVFNWFVRASAIPAIDDTQCGFKMFTAAAVEAVFPWLTIEGWAVDIEVLFIARLRGLRIGEVPIEWHYRDRSQVSVARDSLRMARDVVRIRLNAARGLYDARGRDG